DGEEDQGQGDPGGGGAVEPPRQGAPGDGEDGEAPGEELGLGLAPVARHPGLVLVGAGLAHASSLCPPAGDLRPYAPRWEISVARRPRVPPLGGCRMLWRGAGRRCPPRGRQRAAGGRRCVHSAATTGGGQIGTVEDRRLCVW